MHAIYRNFISALRFNKTAAILNIMGLAIAYIVFATIYAQVDFANKFANPIVEKAIPYVKWIIFTG